MNIIAATAFWALLTATGCTNNVQTQQNSLAPSTENEAASKKIPYTEAKRYFINNAVPEGQLENPKITTAEAFANYFGMATVMGPDGQPTPIDFTKEFVIAVLGKTSNQNPTLSVKSLRKDGEKIVLEYESKFGEQTSYNSRPLILLIVDKKYDAEVVLKETVAENKSK